MWVKALATAILLGLLGSLIGPLVCLFLMPAPAGGACGAWFIIPVGVGVVIGATVGAVTGFLLGLFV